MDTFFFYLNFHEHSQITELQGKEEGIYLSPHYHFHLFHRHLDIGRAITAESSPLHIAARLKLGTFGFQAQVFPIWYHFRQFCCFFIHIFKISHLPPILKILLECLILGFYFAFNLFIYPW